MRSLRLVAPQQLKLDPHTSLPIPPGFQLWKVRHVGICKTDHHLFLHPKRLNITLGHEVVVEHEEQTLVLNNEIACGLCSYCQEGVPSHCVHLHKLGVNADGGYADFIAAPRSHLYPVKVSDSATAVLVEPLACAIHCAERINCALALLPADVAHFRVLIIGAGISGRLIAYALKQLQLDLDMRLFDIQAEASAASQTPYLRAIAEPDAESVHLVVESSGSQQGVAMALSAARRGGVVVLYGMPDATATLPCPTLELLTKELTLLPSLAGCNEETMRQAIHYLQQDEGFFRQLIGKRVNLEQAMAEITVGTPLPGTRTLVTLPLQDSHDAATPQQC